MNFKPVNTVVVPPNTQAICITPDGILFQEPDDKGAYFKYLCGYKYYIKELEGIKLSFVDRHVYHDGLIVGKFIRKNFNQMYSFDIHTRKFTLLNIIPSHSEIIGINNNDIYILLSANILINKTVKSYYDIRDKLSENGIIDVIFNKYHNEIVVYNFELGFSKYYNISHIIAEGTVSLYNNVSMINIGEPYPIIGFVSRTFNSTNSSSNPPIPIFLSLNLNTNEMTRYNFLGDISKIYIYSDVYFILAEKTKPDNDQKYYILDPLSGNVKRFDLKSIDITLTDVILCNSVSYISDKDIIICFYDKKSNIESIYYFKPKSANMKRANH
jgi:hypothetical protein